MKFPKEINGWKKVYNRNVFGNISIIYKKKNKSLELFIDSTWGYHSKNMNVVIRDDKKKSFESSYGEILKVYYACTQEEAEKWAKKYMRSH